jgi:hypothetical protein
LAYQESTVKSFYLFKLVLFYLSWWKRETCSKQEAARFLGGTMKTTRKIYLAALLTALMACGKAPSQNTPTDGSAPTEVKNTLGAVGTWDAFAASRQLVKDDKSNKGNPTPITDASGEPKKFSYPDELVFGETQDYTCEISSYDITRTPEKIVSLDPDSDVVWPGSLIQGGEYGGAKLGSMRPIAVRDGERAPITLSLNLTDGSSYAATVSNPALSTARQALGGLVQTAKLNEADLQNKSTFEMKTSESVASTLLNMNLSINIANKVGLEGARNLDRSQNENRIYVSYLETAYTVNVDAPPSPGDLFTDKFTQARLNEYIGRGEMGPGKPILYVSGVTYGRMLLVEVTTKARREEIENAIKLQIKLTKFNLDAGLTDRQKQLMNESNIRITALGGNVEGNRALVESAASGNIGEGLKKYFSPEYAPRVTQYVPISYAVRDTVSKNYAAISETTKYDITTCLPVVQNPVADIWKLRLINMTQTYKNGEGGEGHFGQLLLQGKSIWRTDDPATNGRDLSDQRVTYENGSLFEVEPLSDNCLRNGEECSAIIYVPRGGSGVFNFEGGIRHRFRVLKNNNDTKRWSRDTYDTAVFSNVKLNPTQIGEGDYLTYTQNQGPESGVKLIFSLIKTPITQKQYNARPR